MDRRSPGVDASESERLDAQGERTRLKALEPGKRRGRPARLIPKACQKLEEHLERSGLRFTEPPVPGLRQDKSCVVSIPAGEAIRPASADRDRCPATL